MLAAYVSIRQHTPQAQVLNACAGCTRSIQALLRLYSGTKVQILTQQPAYTRAAPHLLALLVQKYE
jgi:hypothetical protein